MKYLDREILQKILDSDIIDSPQETISHFLGLSVDSRTIKSGELFFAIVGDNNDGHNYVAGAFERGAAAAVINRDRMNSLIDSAPGLIYAVDDTHEALLNLAAYIRRQIDARFAAVTGSNGKTTTKEMLYSILSVSRQAFRSPGNLNNLFGLPLSLGMMPDDTEYAVFELGISVPGEMTQLASIIKPDLAIILNIGPAHLETLKTIENIVKAKFELVDNLPVGAAIILNADDEYLMREAKRRNLTYIGFGLKNKCEFMAKNISFDASGTIGCEVNGCTLKMPVYGRVNIYNALAAIAASSIWGSGPDDWKQGLMDFRPPDMRLTVESVGKLTLLIDCYNANSESTKASLDALCDMPVKGRRIAILGDMLELGEHSQRLHIETGKYAACQNIDYLFCFGPEAVGIGQGARQGGMKDERIITANTHQEVLDALLEVIKADDAALIKGSRGMRMEKIVFGLKGTAFKNN